MEWMLMPLRRYAEFSGRSRRKEYWMYTLGIILVSIVLGFIMSLVGGATSAVSVAKGDPTVGFSAMFATMGALSLVYVVFWLALLIPSLAVTVRRLHDTDRSGWWVLAPFGAAVLMFVSIPISAVLSLIFSLVYFGSGLILFVFMLLRGTNGPNRYGEDPKGGTSAEVFA